LIAPPADAGWIILARWGRLFCFPQLSVTRCHVPDLEPAERASGTKKAPEAWPPGLETFKLQRSITSEVVRYRRRSGTRPGRDGARPISCSYVPIRRSPMPIPWTQRPWPIHAHGEIRQCGGHEVVPDRSASEV